MSKEEMILETFAKIIKLANHALEDNDFDVFLEDTLKHIDGRCESALTVSIVKELSYRRALILSTYLKNTRAKLELFAFLLSR